MAGLLSAVSKSRLRERSRRIHIVLSSRKWNRARLLEQAARTGLAAEHKQVRQESLRKNCRNAFPSCVRGGCRFPARGFRQQATQVLGRDRGLVAGHHQQGSRGVPGGAFRTAFAPMAMEVPMPSGQSSLIT